MNSIKKTVVEDDNCFVHSRERCAQCKRFHPPMQMYRIDLEMMNRSITTTYEQRQAIRALFTEKMEDYFWVCEYCYIDLLCYEPGKNKVMTRAR